MQTQTEPAILTSSPKLLLPYLIELWEIVWYPRLIRRIIVDECLEIGSIESVLDPWDIWGLQLARLQVLERDLLEKGVIQSLSSSEGRRRQHEAEGSSHQRVAYASACPRPNRLGWRRQRKCMSLVHHEPGRDGKGTPWLRWRGHGSETPVHPMACGVPYLFRARRHASQPSFGAVDE